MELGKKGILEKKGEKGGFVKVSSVKAYERKRRKNEASLKLRQKKEIREKKG